MPVSTTPPQEPSGQSAPDEPDGGTSPPPGYQPPPPPGNYPSPPPPPPGGPGQYPPPGNYPPRHVWWSWGWGWSGRLPAARRRRLPPGAGGYPPPGAGGYPAARRLPPTWRLPPPAAGDYQPPGAGGYAPPGSYPPPGAGAAGYAPPGNYPPPPRSWTQPGAGWQQPGPGWGGPDGRPAGYLAGWWRRVGATLIDGILVGIVAAIILGLAGVTTGARSLLEVLIQLIYLIVLLGGNGGRTLGNMALRTRTINARTGLPCAYDRAVPRSLVQVVLGITVIGGILDILWPLWDHQNQTLHDKAAGTVVLRTDLGAHCSGCRAGHSGPSRPSRWSVGPAGGGALVGPRSVERKMVAPWLRWPAGPFSLPPGGRRDPLTRTVPFLDKPRIQ